MRARKRGGSSGKRDSSAIVTVSANSFSLTLQDRAHSKFRISEAVWREVIQSAAEDNAPKTLTFRLADPVRSTDCGGVDVHVSGAVMVYKNVDIVAPNAMKTGGME